MKARLMVLVWLETASFLSWVVKDFSWVLLIPETAWVALLCALIFESWDIQNHWKVADRYDLAGRFVLLLWILGNGTWMSSELLYENPSKNITFPWFQGALLGPRTYVDRELKVLAGSFWALALLLGICTQMLGRSQQDGRALRSRLNADLWVIFWVLKDFFWLLALPWNALACSVIIFYCLIDLRPSTEPKVLTAALISWLCGNTLWLVGELLLADTSVLPRALTCICLIGSFGLGIKNFFEQEEPEARNILPKSMGTVNHGKL